MFRFESTVTPSTSDADLEPPFRRIEPSVLRSLIDPDLDQAEKCTKAFRIGQLPEQWRYQAPGLRRQQ
jgi:hypothetical protein